MTKLTGTPFPMGEGFTEVLQATIKTQHAKARAKESFRLMARPPALDCGQSEAGVGVSVAPVLADWNQRIRAQEEIPRALGPFDGPKVLAPLIECKVFFTSSRRGVTEIIVHLASSAWGQHDMDSG